MRMKFKFKVLSSTFVLKFFLLATGALLLITVFKRDFIFKQNIQAEESLTATTTAPVQNKVKELTVESFREKLNSIQEKASSNLDFVKSEKINEGFGDEIQKGDRVNVHVVVLDDTGLLLRSTYEDGAPIRVHVGERLVEIPLDEALIGMKAGEKKRVFIPRRFLQSVPENSQSSASFTFEIFVADIENS